ncbi:MAG TPA: DUF2752 domain-containing protein [Lachnospiraceae bacterium]|nr:DUF2752 domain-containing protein [Lachnospiraceae bacterium]
MLSVRFKGEAWVLTCNPGKDLQKRDAEERTGPEDELFRIGLIFLAIGAGTVAAYYAWFHRFLPQIPCFFSEVLGIYCPGCGGTRAVEALLHGRFLQALWYHPLVPYGAFLFGGFMLTQAMKRLGVRGIKGWKYHNWYLYGAVILILVNFLVKNGLRLGWGILM